MSFNQQPSRPQPKMPTQNYETFAIRSPLTTHFRRARCAEVACAAYREGWTYREQDLDEKLLYLVTHAGKRYRRVTASATESYLVFEPGQACFAASTHRIKLERPEFFYAGRGDFRSFSTRRAVQYSSDDWLDKFANDLDSVRTQIERG